MNPTKLDITKLDKLATELGYTYRRGIKPGAGYNVVDDISGDTVLGDDDYTASLKAVKEYLDNVAKQLKAKAKALGYSYERDDDEDREGYVLLEDNTGDIVLGDGYSATLKDIRAFLDSAADDLGVDVEVTKAKVEPPSREDIAESLRGHHAAKEIRAMMKSAKVADQSGRLTLHDLIMEDQRREARKRSEIEQRWKTNRDSLHDQMPAREREWVVNCFENPEKDHANYMAAIEREEAAFIPPDIDGYATPKPATGFQVVSKGRKRLAA